MKKQLSIIIGGGNTLIISVLQNLCVNITTRLRGAKGFFAVFFCALFSAAMASCCDYGDVPPENPELTITVDSAWQGQKVYDLDGNLLYTVTASGDTIWNDGKEVGDGND